MTRFPQVGRVKTRLVPAIGVGGAVALHAELAAHCVRRMRPLQATGEAIVEIQCDGGSLGKTNRWLGSWAQYERQAEGDLGDRLRFALQRSIASGASAAAVLGSDCPHARATHVRNAFALLDAHDVVIGPAEDGGYWMLAVTAKAAPRALRALFHDVEWGGSRVLFQTEQLAAAAGLKVALAERLADVDRPEDLDLWYAERARELQTPQTVAVIIPALNEAQNIAAAVNSAWSGGASEVVVVDGGSKDATATVAKEAGAQVIEAPAGRATQMNAGAQKATADALLFLHADTRLPAGFASLACESLAASGTSAGAFSWATDDHPHSSAMSWLGRTRARIFRLPYGDQALFLPRRTFEDLGGYPLQPVMEDWELAKRLTRLGDVRILPQPVTTSSRRWTEGGLFLPSAAYLAIIAGYRLGMDPSKLDTWRRPRSDETGAVDASGGD